ncbi:hypothetical protein [Microbulbifer spongiae]|uniref:Uncharacterized protein n=1 Tax=Microbulbifer spongiae TaxID=2944933 RepID=A0ABY9EJZ6_9GAMM|nr:hypothetical protein [Microbulbifer sp. MI-G]WKD51681.1 hypothetical protein M8T91_18675 [Microbulbifer sp. MI-G]
MASKAKQHVRIVQPCMAAGQPAPLGKVLVLAIGEANQLIGTGRAQAVPATEKGRAGNKKTGPDSATTAVAALTDSSNNGE